MSGAMTLTSPGDQSNNEGDAVSLSQVERKRGRSSILPLSETKP